MSNTDTTTKLSMNSVALSLPFFQSRSRLDGIQHCKLPLPCCRCSCDPVQLLHATPTVSRSELATCLFSYLLPLLLPVPFIFSSDWLPVFLNTCLPIGRINCGKFCQAIRRESGERSYRDRCMRVCGGGINRNQSPFCVCVSFNRDTDY